MTMHILGMGRSIVLNERDVSWIQCWMHNGLALGYSAWQIDRPSNGSVWKYYSFQPVGLWMGYSFTDLGAEGCCSLNAMFNNVTHLVPSVSLVLFSLYINDAQPPLEGWNAYVSPGHIPYSVTWSFIILEWKRRHMWDKAANCSGQST